MNSDPHIETTEELREALLTLRRENDSLTLATDQAQHLLDALESLLSVDSAQDPFDRVFSALRRVFTFSSALMLAEKDEHMLECIVADPSSLIGSVWPALSLFRKVMAGRVVATFSNIDIEEWRQARPAGLSIDHAALYAPVRVRDRRGILMLLRAPGVEGFDRNHIALARKFSVLASHALAARYASQSEAEGRRLRELAQQLRASEQKAKRNTNLLNEIVNALPVGVTVQDEEGAILLINDAAAHAFGRSVAELQGSTPFDIEGQSGGREKLRLQYQQHLRSATQHTEEHAVVDEGSTRTLLTTYKPVRIFDETLLVSASLDISERKRFEDELSRRAFHDQLTGLPNRALMAETVEAALREHQRSGMFALAFIDLDNFKQVNDYYSHALGDTLLVDVARRVSDTIRRTDTLARMSGDEFLLLVNPLQGEEDLPPMMERVFEALKQPFVVEGHELLISASVGISIYPRHGRDYESLRRCADSAMYRSKRERKGSASYFDLTMRDGLTARMELEQRFRAAIRDRHFRAAFQPKVRMRTNEVVGFEALVRWVEPDGTVNMPGSFIELALELGFIDDITRFVLHDVVNCMPRLIACYGDKVTVSINISARQAGDVEFMHAFIDQLAASGMARRIVLELTEDALVATQRFQRQVLPRLRELGVCVSIDDFGTGYSSLSTLADITADEVKVDRAFITSIQDRPRSQGILKAIESLCSALDISMVAEGVETADELAYLRRNTSIEFAQGYHFSKPKFIDELMSQPPALRLVSNIVGR
jgi:cyclic di-GMP phosphodiesterase Gmr